MTNIETLLRELELAACEHFHAVYMNDGQLNDIVRKRHDAVLEARQNIRAELKKLADRVQVLEYTLQEIADSPPWGGTDEDHIAWMQTVARSGLTTEAEQNLMKLLAKHYQAGFEAGKNEST